MSDPARWTTPAAIAAAVRRRWDDGSLLRAYAADAPFSMIDVPLRGPSPVDLGEHFDAARAWADALRRGSRDGTAYALRVGRIGGRVTGATELPTRALVESYNQAWRLLGMAERATRFRSLVVESAAVPAAREWALAHPIAAVDLAPEWTRMLAAYGWLDAHRGSGLYLRQITAPGVDTKFVERHHGPLAAMLGVPAGRRAFALALGLSTRPATVRLRFNSDALRMPDGVSEAVLRADELDALGAHVRRALIVENEVSYLSVPIPEGGVVLWGRGYDVDVPASLRWLRGADVAYWGDIDTHGFAILDRVRAHIPEARSVMMDRATLFAHEDRWGEDRATTNIALPRLAAPEASLYADLVTDRFGLRVQLEQERIGWGWARAALREAGLPAAVGER